ncbi:hypothetical protein [Streptomyces sp. NPDC057052]|uniref:hypothetical protein n=1 Tax=Streptomyces sp. NPDC057052 TaxID=3346010 RepID=UPI003637D658
MSPADPTRRHEAPHPTAPALGPVLVVMAALAVLAAAVGPAPAAPAGGPGRAGP